MKGGEEKKRKKGEEGERGKDGKRIRKQYHEDFNAR